MNYKPTGEERGLAIEESLRAEHNEIHGMMRDFKALTAIGAPGSVKEFLDRFIEFCRSHFDHEEAALRKYREMALEKHVAAHGRLLDGLCGLQDSIENGEGGIRSALGAWYTAMTNHIDQYDQPALERLLVGQTGARAAERRWQTPDSGAFRAGGEG